MTDITRLRRLLAEVGYDDWVTSEEAHEILGDEVSEYLPALLDERASMLQALTDTGAANLALRVRLEAAERERDEALALVAELRVAADEMEQS